MTATTPEKTSFDTVYLEELKWIKQRRQVLREQGKLPSSEDDRKLDGHIPEAKPAAVPPRLLHELQADALKADLCGLAISGGGIRSATYGLGVLQGLAAIGLLPRFDYLSTVSGGGFIGAWFSTWVNREGFDEVERKLLPPRRQKIATPEVEAEPIRHLRLYSNYLAPRPGLFSFDGWVLIAIYLRNLLLNQLVLMFAVLMLFASARMIVETFSIAHGPSLSNEFSLLCSVMAFVMLVVALFGAAVFALGGCLKRNDDCGFTLFRFWMVCVVPWLLATLFASLLFSAPIAIGWVVGEEFGWNLAKAAVAIGVSHGMLGLASFSCRFRALFSGVVTGLVGGMMIWLAWASLLTLAKYQGVTVAAVVTFGVPLSLCVYVLTNFLMVGLCGPKLSELEREWWSSVNSRLMMLAAGWMVLFGTAVFGPWLFGQVVLHSNQWYGYATGAAGAAWLSTLVAGLKAAQSVDTHSTSRGGLKESLARLAPVLFLITLLFAAAVLTTCLAYEAYARLSNHDEWGFIPRLKYLLSDLNEPKPPISLRMELPTSIAGSGFLSQSTLATLKSGFELPTFLALFLVAGVLGGAL